jgi:hypothetical protein
MHLSLVLVRHTSVQSTHARLARDQSDIVGSEFLLSRPISPHGKIVSCLSAAVRSPPGSCLIIRSKTCLRPTHAHRLAGWLA